MRLRDRLDEELRELELLDELELELELDRDRDELLLDGLEYERDLLLLDEELLTLEGWLEDERDRRYVRERVALF